MCQVVVFRVKTVVICKYRVSLMLTRKGLYLADRPPDTKCMWEVILHNGRARTHTLPSSSTQGEYRAMAQTTCGLVWLRQSSNKF